MVVNGRSRCARFRGMPTSGKALRLASGPAPRRLCGPPFARRVFRLPPSGRDMQPLRASGPSSTRNIDSAARDWCDFSLLVIRHRVDSIHRISAYVGIPIRACRVARIRTRRGIRSHKPPHARLLVALIGIIEVGGCIAEVAGTQRSAARIVLLISQPGCGV